MNRFIYIILLLSLVITSIVNCGKDTVAGGTEIGNPVVVGCIVNTNGSPIQNANVFLVSENSNPLREKTIYSTQTDESGKYVFSDIDSGYFTLNAIHPSNNARIRYTVIHVNPEIEYQKGSDTLFYAGTITVSIQNSVFTPSLAVYIPGTDIFRIASSPGPLSLTSPIGRVDVVCYDTIAGRIITEGPNFISVPVESGKETTIDKHTVSVPSKPEGSNKPSAGIKEKYKTQGSYSNLEHPVEYRFAWINYDTDPNSQNPTSTEWGFDTLIIAWPAKGKYKLRTQARSTLDTNAVSAWSEYISIEVQE